MAELEIEDVAQNVNFPAEEEKILAYWDEIDAFKTSLKCAPPLSAGLGQRDHLFPAPLRLRHHA